MRSLSYLSSIKKKKNNQIPTTKLSKNTTIRRSKKVKRIQTNMESELRGKEKKKNLINHFLWYQGKMQIPMFFKSMPPTMVGRRRNFQF